jgi:(p)ppGpp synthase/HD superfamily hydrolase
MNLDRALEIAARAHAGQTDKAGAPYILHPLRVMMRMRGRDEQVTAVLHDVVEDSEWSLDDLRAAGFSDRVVQAVDALTKREGEGYDAYLGRVQQNFVAVRVKLGDLQDNMNLHRIMDPGKRDYERLARYERAWNRLTGLE